MAVKLGTVDSRPVTRETAVVSRGRKVLITLEANGVYLAIREKGTRTVYRCPIETAFWYGVKALVAERKAAKLAARKERQARS